MTKKEIISLSLKLAGIYCLIMAISHLGYAVPSVVSSLMRQGFWSMITSISTFLLLLLSLTPSVLLLLLGVYLIFSNALPSKMAASMIQEEKTTSCTFLDIQVLAFSIIGVWLIAGAISNFIQPVVRVIVLHSTSRPVSFFQSSYFISQILIGVLKLALGIYLFLGAKGLTKLWQKFQSPNDIKPSN